MSLNYDPNETGYSLKCERAAVAKGAALLDKILPGWHKKVRLSRLDMSNGQMCMLGQLFGTGVEAKLAKEMYPKEMANVEVYGGSYGYSRATTPDYSGVAGPSNQTLLQRLMTKLGLSGKKTYDAQLMALRHVCSGHDNKCLWSEAVAERRAADGEKNASSK